MNKKEKEDKKYFDSIENIFKYAGFLSLPVEGKYFYLNGRPKCELDHCFILKNIIIICEQTIGDRDTDHLIRKQETAEAINNNKEAFLFFLHNNFNDKFDKAKYSHNRWKIYFLYFSKKKINFSNEDKERYNRLQFISNGVYNYFIKMSKCIKKSFRYEILRFLDIKYLDFNNEKDTPSSTKEVSIIYPNDVTGLNRNVNIVSFMMSPEQLLRTSYVLRKDNWEDKIELYQRLLTPSRIKNVRKFIINKKRTFFNNIIVGLPDSTKIFNKENKEIDFNNLNGYENYKMTITNEFNEISIIDGQHRIYAYYENEINDLEEKEISKLRKDLNLLVTGILFPKDWTDKRRRQFEAELFLEINRNSKNVDKDILIHIESMSNPNSPLSIARAVLKDLNQQDPFENKFELSSVEGAQIKVSTIIQFALKSLISSLYIYWAPSDNTTKPAKLNDLDDKYLEEYTKYCSSILRQYFKAVKNRYKNFWNDSKSHILKIVSINGFIIALNHSLKFTDGPQNFEYYNEIFSLTNFDFSKGKFPYSGSKYKKFATDIIPIFKNRNIDKIRQI